MNDLFPKIVVIKRNGADGRQFPLRTNECLFGRKPECDIRIQLPNVSLEHAILQVDFNDRKIKLVNLSSCNETLVNGKPISAVEIEHLDVLTISDRSFRFEFPLPVQKSPQNQHYLSSTLVNTPQEKKTPKMPTPKGSPRTPPTGGSLKENIYILRRHSMPLQEEEEEALASPANDKTPFSIIDVNAEPEEGSSDLQLVSERKSREEHKTQRRSKRVSFGPVLSPEQFDKDLPPATPVRRGSAPKRCSISGDHSLVPVDSSAKKRRSVAALPLEESIQEEECDAAGPLENEVPQTKKQQVHIPEIPADLSTELSEFAENKQLARTSGMAEESQPIEIEQATPTRHRRSSLRLAGKSPSLPELESGPVVQSQTFNPADYVEEQMDETVLDSDDYTSDEEDALGKADCEKETLTDPDPKQSKKKMATPLRKEINSGIQLRRTKKKMATPLRKAINSGIQLRQTKMKMATPLRKEIISGVQLRQTKKKMATPLRKEINSGIQLRQTTKKMATPLRKAINSGIQLRQTKKKMATPLRKEINSGVWLRQTKKKMATPLRKQITSGVQLRQTKKMATPLRKEITSGVQLRQTMKKMATPLRKEITSGVQLRQTMKKMATPLRKEINSGVQLWQTKKKMATPLRKEITSGVQLRQTKKKMATPLRKQITSGIQLRQTKKMATPLRKEINSGVRLRQTKKKMATPLRKEIESRVSLRQTKKKLATPLKEDIIKGIQLREMRKKLKTPIRKAIERGVSLRVAKKKLSTPLQKAIQGGPKLCQSMKTMDPRLQDEIKRGTKLRKKQAMPLELQIEIIKGNKLNTTKNSLPTPLKKSISNGVPLKKTKKSLPTPVRRQVEKGIALKRVNKSSKRKRSEDGVPTSEPKKLKLSPNGRTGADEEPKVVQISRSLKTPLRKAIVSGTKLRPTRRRMATPVRRQIHSKPTLRAIHRKKSVPRKPTYAEIVRRLAKKSAVSREFTTTDATPPTTISDAVLTKPEVPSRNPPREIDPKGRHEKTSLGKKKTPVQRKRSSWMSSLARATNGVKTRAASIEDFQGVAEMFLTPPPVQISAERSSKKQRTGNWLSSLAKATNGPRRRAGAPVEDFVGLAEMLVTPPCVGRVTRSTVEQTTPSPGEQELQLITALKPTKTPSLRRSGKDTAVVVEVATPVVQSSCKSVQSENRDTTPQVMPQIVEPLEPSKTPSLRHSAEEIISLQVETPVQVSRTPSHRSAKKQSSVVTNESPELQLEFVPPLETSKTPSMRSADKVRLSEMLVTPPSVSRVTRSTVEQTTPSPGEQELQLITALKPTKTPSLRRSGKDTAVVVEVATPVQSSCKSVQSENRDTTPQVRLQIVEPLEPSKTPSLRHSAEEVISLQVVTPVQVSRTPSLRSAKKQSSVVTNESPELQPVEDFLGLSEMLVTSPSVGRVTRSTVEQTTPSPGEQELQLITALKPTKTPSLRRSGKVTAVVVEVATPVQSSCKSVQSENRDTTPQVMPQIVEPLEPSKTPSLRHSAEEVISLQVVTPVQVSRTPSLRSCKSVQSENRDTTPQVMLQITEPLEPSKTPSLRHSAEEIISLQVETPVQVSRTPSLRSAKKQSSVVTNESPELQLEFVPPLETSKTPSMRSADKVRLSEMLVTPPSVSRVTRSTVEQTTPSPGEQELQLITALKPTKTPSLRRSGKDTAVVVEVATPVQSSCKSVQSENRDTTPQVRLQIVEPLESSKTPSLRHSAEEVISLQVVTPVQVSRTPSLRSCKSVQSENRDTTPQVMPQIVEPLEPSKTPSLRHSAEEVISLQVETPVQVSRTPSLRSAKKQSSVVTNESPELQPVEDFVGLSEMLVTSPSVDRVTRSTVEQTTPSPGEQELQLITALKPTKTPSLRRSGKDTAVVVEVATPVQSSCKSVQSENRDTTPQVMLQITEPLEPSKTPSLRHSAEAVISLQVVTPVQVARTPSLRSCKSVQSKNRDTTPQVMPQIVEPLEPSKTPSLRHSAEAVISLQVVTPVQVSHTPSHRSAKKQSSVVTNESPELQLEFVPPLETSKTPSMRSADKVKIVLQKSGRNPRNERKSLGLKGLQRLMKSPKENNAVENCEDLFVTNMFTSPNPQPKCNSPKSEGLQEVKRLLRTSDAMEKTATESPKLNGIKAMMRQTKEELASPNFVGLRILMQTPKATETDDLEEHFNPELFATAEADPSPEKNASSTKLSVPIIDLTSPETQSKVVKHEVNNEATKRTTRAKRNAPKWLTEPEPKRVRRTRSTVDRENDGKPKNCSDPKATQKKTNARSKRNPGAVKQTTSKAFVFKRTQLDPIIEVPSPMTSLDNSIKVIASSPLTHIEEDDPPRGKRSTRRNATQMTTETKAPLQSRCRGKCSQTKAESSSEESSKVEVAENRSSEKTKRDGGVGSAEKKAAKIEEPKMVKTRSTRKNPVQEASTLDYTSIVQDKEVSSLVKDRATRSRSAQVSQAEEHVANESTNSATRRSRRGTKTVEENVSVFEETKSTRSTRSQESHEHSEDSRSTRRTRNSHAEKIIAEEEAQQESSVKRPRAKRELKGKASNDPVLEETKPTRRTRSQDTHENSEHSRSTTRNSRTETIIEEEDTKAQQESSAKRSRANRELKAKASNEPKKTRSARNAKLTQDDEQESANTSRATRGTKRSIEDDTARSAAPEPKRTRSSSRIQTRSSSRK